MDSTPEFNPPTEEELQSKIQSSRQNPNERLDPEGNLNNSIVDEFKPEPTHLRINRSPQKPIAFSDVLLRLHSPLIDMETGLLKSEVFDIEMERQLSTYNHELKKLNSPDSVRLLVWKLDGLKGIPDGKREAILSLMFEIQNREQNPIPINNIGNNTPTNSLFAELLHTQSEEEAISTTDDVTKLMNIKKHLLLDKSGLSQDEIERIVLRAGITTYKPGESVSEFKHRGITTLRRATKLKNGNIAIADSDSKLRLVSPEPRIQQNRG